MRIKIDKDLFYFFIFSFFIGTLYLLHTLAFAQMTNASCVITKVGNPTASAPAIPAVCPQPGSGRTGNFVYYCQGNTAWQACLLGQGGCGPTSLAMVLSTFGIMMTPPEVDAIFQQNGWRSCSDAGSVMQGGALDSQWLKSLGITVGPNLVSNYSNEYDGQLDFNLAKQFIDKGYLIIASSTQFPLVNSKSGGTGDHIFVIDNIDPAAQTISVRDPNNCSYADGNDEIKANIIRNIHFLDGVWYYAYPLKKV